MKKLSFLLALTIVWTSLGIQPISAFAANNEATVVQNTGDDEFDNQNPMRLWYDEETNFDYEGAESPNGDKGSWERWALPIGNGYMGVKVFGRTETERLQITENSMVGAKGLTNFAEVYLDVGHKFSEVTNYSRDLVLDDATSNVKYDYNGVTYNREVFASYPDKVTVVKLSASEKGKVNFTLRPEIPYLDPDGTKYNDGNKRTGTVTANEDTITLGGEFGPNLIQYEGQIRVVPTGGTMSESNDGGNGKITVSDADSALVIIAVGTNYKLSSQVFTNNTASDKLKGFEHPHEKVTNYLNDASKKSYEELKANHLADYQELFGRVKVEWCGAYESAKNKTTDTLLNEYKSGTRNEYLEQLYFQYGRYMLIASSRKGTLPPNLQGIWNTYRAPSWTSGYWHNINMQMNYWPVFSTNLAELFECYEDFFEAYSPKVKDAATRFIANTHPNNLRLADDNGWSIGTGNNAYTVACSGGSGNDGNGTGALMAKSFYEYYKFTGGADGTLSKEELESLYQTVLSSAIFMTKVMEPYGDKLLADPSSSPEQQHNGSSYTTVGSSWDQQNAYEMHKCAIEMAEELGHGNDKDILMLKERMDKLDPVVIGASGQIKEYREENYYGEIGEYTHRHISQLVGLYPGTIINDNTPAWRDAAEYTLTERGDKSTGWAMAHRFNAWARLKKGERAYDLFKQLLSTGTYENLWDTHPPFQIDGNFGGTAAVAEMLMQSHEGYIDVLPSIPSAWTSGSYSGLAARDNFEVAAKWSNGKADKIRITSKNGGECSVRYRNLSGATVTDENGASVNFTSNGDMITFDTEKGKSYIISSISVYEEVAAPSGLQVETLNIKDANLTWEISSDAVSYNVYRAVESAADYELVADKVMGNTYQYSASDDTDGLQTTWKVTAVNAEGHESDGTLFLQEGMTLSAPKTAVGKELSENRLQISAEPVSEAEMYIVYKKNGDTYDDIASSKYSTIIIDNYKSGDEYSISAKKYKFESEKTAVTMPTGEVTVIDNVLLKKPIEASKGVNSSFPLSNALDGDLTTRYAVGDSDAPYSITIDLESEYMLSKLDIYEWIPGEGGTRAGKVQIEVLDGSEWKTIVKDASLIVSKKNSDFTSFDLDNAFASKLRITFQNTSGYKNSACMRELICSGIEVDTGVSADTNGTFAMMTSEGAKYMLDNFQITRAVPVVGENETTEIKIADIRGEVSGENTLNITANVKNAYDTSKQVTVLAAVYDENGVLKDFAAKENTELLQGDNDVTFVNMNIENVTSAKVFVFDDMKTLNPVCVQAEKTISELTSGVSAVSLSSELIINDAVADMDGVIIYTDSSVGEEQLKTAATLTENGVSKAVKVTQVANVSGFGDFSDNDTAYLITKEGGLLADKSYHLTISGAKAKDSTDIDYKYSFKLENVFSDDFSGELNWKLADCDDTSSLSVEDGKLVVNADGAYVLVPNNYLDISNLADCTVKFDFAAINENAVKFGFTTDKTLKSFKNAKERFEISSTGINAVFNGKNIIMPISSSKGTYKLNTNGLKYTLYQNGERVFAKDRKPYGYVGDFDKTELLESLKLAQAVNISALSDEDRTELEKLVSEGNKLAEDLKAKQTDIDAAAKALNDFIKAFDVTINNAPVAQNVVLSGDASVYGTLTATYKYYDADGDEEDTARTKYIWEVSEDGETWSAIGGETSKRFVVPSSDYIGKYVRVGVKVYSKDSEIIGSYSYSPSTAAIQPCQNVDELTYTELKLEHNKTVYKVGDVINTSDIHVTGLSSYGDYYDLIGSDKLTFTSSNKAVAKIESGEIKILATGIAQLTATFTSADGTTIQGSVLLLVHNGKVSEMGFEEDKYDGYTDDLGKSTSTLLANTGIRSGVTTKSWKNWDLQRVCSMTPNMVAQGWFYDSYETSKSEADISFVGENSEQFRVGVQHGYDDYYSVYSRAGGRKNLGTGEMGVGPFQQILTNKDNPYGEEVKRSKGWHQVVLVTEGDKEELYTDCGSIKLYLDGIKVFEEAYNLQSINYVSGFGYDNIKGYFDDLAIFEYVRTDEIPNKAPEATNIEINGDLEEYGTVTASYTYYDYENDGENADKVIYKWQTSTDGVNWITIDGEQGPSVTIPGGTANGYLRVGVKVRAKTGTLLGDYVYSDSSDKIGMYSDYKNLIYTSISMEHNKTVYQVGEEIAVSDIHVSGVPTIGGVFDLVGSDKLTFTSSDESVAKIENGVLKFIKTGMAIVTAKHDNADSTSVKCTIIFGVHNGEKVAKEDWEGDNWENYVDGIKKTSTSLFNTGKRSLLLDKPDGDWNNWSLRRSCKYTSNIFAQGWFYDSGEKTGSRARVLFQADGKDEKGNALAVSEQYIIGVQTPSSDYYTLYSRAGSRSKNPTGYTGVGTVSNILTNANNPYGAELKRSKGWHQVVFLQEGDYNDRFTDKGSVKIFIDGVEVFSEKYVLTPLYGMDAFGHGGTQSYYDDFAIFEYIK